MSIKKQREQRRKSNPNRSNQYKPDPRQTLFLSYYINPKSETFSNARKSAIRAGYSPEYADSITSEFPTWLEDKLGDLKRLKRAENVLDETLDIPVETLEWEGSGDDKTQIVVTNPALVKVRQDTAKFVAERLGRKKYSTHHEIDVTSGGRPLRELNDDELFTLAGGSKGGTREEGTGEETPA